MSARLRIGSNELWRPLASMIFMLPAFMLLIALTPYMQVHLWFWAVGIVAVVGTLSSVSTYAVRLPQNWTITGRRNVALMASVPGLMAAILLVLLGPMVPTSSLWFLVVLLASAWIPGLLYVAYGLFITRGHDGARNS